MTPLIARCLHEYIRPNITRITKNIQNNSQYGFTENIAYLMGALQRHEVENSVLMPRKHFLAVVWMVNRPLKL